MKLRELLTETKVIDGYKFDVEEDREDDNIKMWYHLTPPNGKSDTLDYSPYVTPSDETLKKFIAFHKKHGRFPTRKDVKSTGPLRDKDLDKLV